jgi:hypothetical protein
MVLGRADEHPEGHRLIAGVNRAATQHHGLCVGDNDMMKTDLKGLLSAGLELSEELWKEAAGEFAGTRGSTATSSTRSRRSTRTRSASGWTSSPAACPQLPRLRQHRAGLRAIHPGRWHRRLQTDDRSS